MMSQIIFDPVNTENHSTLAVDVKTAVLKGIYHLERFQEEVLNNSDMSIRKALLRQAFKFC